MPLVEIAKAPRDLHRIAHAGRGNPVGHEDDHARAIAFRRHRQRVLQRGVDVGAAPRAERIREAHRLPHVLRARGPELVGEGIERVAEGDHREAILGVQIREAALERIARLVDLARVPHRAAGVEDEEDVLVDDVLRARQFLGRGEQEEVAALFALRLEGHEGETEPR